MPDQKQSILIGAAVTAALSTSYLGLINCLCCAGVVIGSLVTVWHYTSRYDLTIEAGRGAVMGLVAAAVGAVISLLLNYLLLQVGLGGQEVIVQSIMEAFSGYVSPEQMEMMREQMEAQRDVSFGAYLINGLVTVFVFALVGAVGGAIGAAIFKKGGEQPATEW